MGGYGAIGDLQGDGSMANSVVGRVSFWGPGGYFWDGWLVGGWVSNKGMGS